MGGNKELHQESVETHPKPSLLRSSILQMTVLASNQKNANKKSVQENRDPTITNSKRNAGD